jgi:hypothetical protein
MTRQSPQALDIVSLSVLSHSRLLDSSVSSMSYHNAVLLASVPVPYLAVMATSGVRTWTAALPGPVRVPGLLVHPHINGLSSKYFQEGMGVPGQGNNLRYTRGVRVFKPENNHCCVQLSNCKECSQCIHRWRSRSIPSRKLFWYMSSCVVETVRTVKNFLDHWRIESIILFLYVDLEKPMIASIAHVSDVIGML